jgi:NTE family protein
MRREMLTFVLLACTAISFGEAKSEPGDVPPVTDRPKIGLALGGGGALGMAHIGVLRILEEQRIPIDYIAGTSMGAVIGGLYANGMSPDEIEAFLQGLDWNEVLTDATPRRELAFRRKQEDQRYLLEVGLGRSGIKMGTGMSAGQKFNNLLELQTMRSASITDFNQLPIPFRAVSTDLLSGKPYVIDHGNLALAMRASMAVPGAFTAVEIDGRLMVDGGIVDNLPVDVVRSMGADIVIAVDVGAKSDKVDPDELKSIAGVLSRTYMIMRRPGQLESFEKADIGLQPDMDEFSASEFARVTELVEQGSICALEHLPSLGKLSVDPESYTEFLEQQRLAPPGDVRIDEITISGNDRVAGKAIEGRIRSKTGVPFDEKAMQLDLMRIYGIGEFEQVLFQLEQKTNDTAVLNYSMLEKAWGPLYLALGLHLRSDFENDTSWGVLLNLTRRSINRLGAEWRNELKIGNSQGALSEFYQPLDYGGVMFVAPEVSYLSEPQDVYDNHDHIAEYNVKNLMAKFDFGLQLRRYAELRVGPAVGNYDGDVEIGLAGLPEFDDDYVAMQGSLIIDRKDRTYFPREGYYFSTYGLFPREQWGGDVSFDRLSVDFSVTESFSDHTLEARLNYGSDLGGGLPVYAQFPLGGLQSFSGLSKYQFRGSTLGVFSLGYRYRLIELPSQLGRGVYTITRYDTGNAWDGNVDLNDIRHGFGIGIGADTIIGPCYLVYGVANGGYQSVYFSLGGAF